MNTYSVARCISALVLVIAASVIGMPLPASASGEGKVVVSRHQALTINGRPLAQLLSATATARGAVPLPGLLEQVDGQISGVVVDAAGRPVAEHAVQLMRLFTLGGNPAEQISGTRMTDAEGGFSFSRGEFQLGMGLTRREPCRADQRHEDDRCGGRVHGIAAERL